MQSDAETSDHDQTAHLAAVLGISIGIYISCVPTDQLSDRFITPSRVSLLQLYPSALGIIYYSCNQSIHLESVVAVYLFCMAR